MVELLITVHILEYSEVGTTDIEIDIPLAGLLIFFDSVEFKGVDDAFVF